MLGLILSILLIVLFFMNNLNSSFFLQFELTLEIFLFFILLYDSDHFKLKIFQISYHITTLKSFLLQIYLKRIRFSLHFISEQFNFIFFLEDPLKSKNYLNQDDKFLLLYLGLIKHVLVSGSEEKYFFHVNQSILALFH